MARRLYFDDSYLRSFHAQVASAEGRRVFLDSTAFYPTSGGQPFDTGSINGIPVVEVAGLEDGRIAHTLEADLAPGPADCTLNWPRRFDHMQQHTGQHILSAVFVERLGINTVSFHMSSDVSTIDLATPTLSLEQIVTIERAANEVIFEARPIAVSYHDSGEDLGLRKASERTGSLRIVTIADLDRSACGGTHVRNTAEVGAILLRKLDKVRGNVRLEFVCGARAVTHARQDFDTLSRAARIFSAPLDEVDSLVAAQSQRLSTAEKQLRRLAAEAAQREGRERFAQASPNTSGLTVEFRRTPTAMTDESRLRATAFAESGPAVWIELFSSPPSVLVAVSPATGLHAGNLLKPLLTAAGGRGGGSATVAQGSLPAPEGLDAIEAELRRLTGAL
ncbi:MAG: alanyl-tRNA editing protein [Acidobacteriota bacterium]